MQVHKKICRIASAALLCGSLWSAICQANSYDGVYSSRALKGTQQPLSCKQILGKIVDGRYYDCNGWFSMAVPEYAEPRFVEDDHVENRLCDVAFFNDYGYLLKVEVDELIPEVRSIISKHQDVKDEVLDALFHEAIFPQIQSEVPKAELLHQRKIILDSGEPAVFVVLNLPASSSVVDRSTGFSYDSKRGYLFSFSNNRRLINLSMQDTYSLMPRFAQSAKIHLNERLLKHLLRVQQTFRNLPAQQG